MLSNKKRVIILNPPSPKGVTASRDAAGGFGTAIGGNVSPSYPVLDIAYAAAVLRDNKFDVGVIDAVAIPKDISSLASEIMSAEASIIFVRTSTPTYENDVLVAKFLRERTKASVVLFGPHLKFVNHNEWPLYSVDGILIGEPEFAITEVAKSNNWKKVHGLIFYRNGHIFCGKDRNPIDNLDTLPFPAWDLMPIEQYVLGSLSENCRYLTVQTSRGCPLNCGYCPYPVSQGVTYRSRKISGVIKELFYLKNNFNVEYIVFRDPVFTWNIKRATKLCEEIRSSNLNIKWRCETRAELLNPKLLEDMALAGCVGLNVGIETVSETALRKVNRKVSNWSKYEDLFKICKQLEIKTFAFFIVGLPGETKESFLKTVEFAKKLNIDEVQFSVIAPYPGTKVEEWASKHGYIRKILRNVPNFTEVPTMRSDLLSLRDIAEIKKQAENLIKPSWTPNQRKP